MILKVSGFERPPCIFDIKTKRERWLKVQISQELHLLCTYSYTTTTTKIIPEKKDSIKSLLVIEKNLVSGRKVNSSGSEIEK